jgi:cytochrome P450 family 142 subfamily A polypeptide 1
VPNHPIRDDIHLLSRHFYLDAHDAVRWMRDEAAAYFEPDFDELGGVWGLTRHDDIMHASKHPEIFCTG